MPVQPGDILQKRFRIDALIGRGGMGQVFSATDLQSPLAEQVAIKVVSSLLVDKQVMARLHREAEAAQRIQSDFVPRVTEVGENDDGETFLVMERLFGEPLSQRIRDHGALPWNEVHEIGEDVLRGLIDAHTAGIVHRDLKPSNVFLAMKNGRVRAMVLDFGVCKVDGVDAERLTGTGESIGTVAYMAPEQIRGASKVDERADLYAFGAVVFEMLADRLPHVGASQMNILASKLENEAPSLHAHAKSAFPDGVAEIVAGLLVRDPARRYATAQEVLRAWRAIGTNRTLRTPGLVLPIPDEPTVALPEGRSTRPPPPSITFEPNLTQIALAAAAAPAPARPQFGPRLALLLTAASFVLGLAVVGFTVSRSPRPVRPAAAVPAEPASAPAEAVSAEARSVAPEGTAPPVGEAPAGAEAAGEGDPIELPEEPAASGKTDDPPRPRPKRAPRSRPPAAPKITSQPRY